LTLNWAVRWGGLQHEDWRYRQQRENHGRFYWPVSFLGIHLMPTTLVFLGCLPMLPALAAPRQPWNILDTLATLLTAAAILVETRADYQVTQFKKDPTNQGRFLAHGLWGYSRHPNYLGEVAFWWGLYLFGLGANPTYGWTIVGPLSITILFVTISIPMMEKRLLNRYPGYDAYRRRTAILLPWRRRIRKSIPNSHSQPPGTA
jgi:steroid 5-alpha reductase family enzyme